ncbi:MAG: TonB family protein [Deltaproteobacteria bacterium]|jgi:protein TonB|nr:TonB family protein [Deltaproteobacteria bacterium]
MIPQIPRERDIFSETLVVSGLIHLVALGLIFILSQPQPEPIYTPLAVMDFAQYDPLGGNPGDGEKEEVIPPEPEPEPEVAEPEPEPDLVESVAEEAPVIAPPPPPEKKPQTKKKPPKLRPQAPAAGDSLATGGQGGMGGGSGRGTSDLLAAYKSQISRRLNQFKKYPPAAMAKGLKGVAYVSFRVNPNGRVSAARLVTSSGFPVLDEEALALLRRSSPFPPLPESLGLNYLELSAPISFTTRN